MAENTVTPVVRSEARKYGGESVSEKGDTKFSPLIKSLVPQPGLLSIAELERRSAGFSPLIPLSFPVQCMAH